MKQLFFFLAVGLSFTACGGSNATSNFSLPNFSKVNPPSGGNVVQSTELEQILLGPIEKQFTRGIYVEMAGSSSLAISGQIGTDQGSKSINLNCQSQVTTKIVSLGIINQKIYLFSDTTTVGGGITYDSSSNQLACTHTTEQTVAVHLTAVPNNAADLLSILFKTEPDQTVTYYDQGNNFAIYVAKTGSNSTETTDSATLITVQNPRSTPLLGGILSVTGSENTSYLKDSKVVTEDKASSTVTTTKAGTLANLSSIGDQLKAIKVCEGSANQEVCSTQDLSYLAQ